MLAPPEIAELTADTKLDAGLPAAAKPRRVQQAVGAARPQGARRRSEGFPGRSPRRKPPPSSRTWRSWRPIRRCSSRCSGAHSSRRAWSSWTARNARSATSRGTTRAPSRAPEAKLAKSEASAQDAGGAAERRAARSRRRPSSVAGLLAPRAEARAGTRGRTHSRCCSGPGRPILRP